jgi:hypothetical protein
MKTINHQLSTIIQVLVVAALVLTAGCATAPYGKTLASSSALATGALRGWNDYAQARADIGKPVPQSEDETVLDASLKYDLSEGLAQAAYEAWEADKKNSNTIQSIEMALSELGNASSNIVALIKAFSKP